MELTTIAFLSFGFEVILSLSFSFSFVLVLSLSLVLLYIWGINSLDTD